MSEDEIKREILSFETGKMDEILSDLAALIIQFKDLRDKKIVEEKIPKNCHNLRTLANGRC
ncbi:MAG: hypothetical protein WCE96_13220 [Nitrososphaeraceae archaeon]